MFGELDHVRICGMRTVVPGHRVKNLEEFSARFGEKKVKRQIRMTGMEERCVAQDGVTSALLCETAARQLMEELHWEADCVRVVLYVTETPDFIFPSTAFYLQRQLGIGEDCVVYDINLGCSGWIVGMQTISAIMQGIEPIQEKPVRALLLAGSICTSHVSEEDFSLSMLFGDAGTATALEWTPKAGILQYMQKSDGRSYRHIFKETHESPMQMDGAAVFEFTINEVVDSVKKFVEHFRIDVSEIDYFVFHQAQRFIVDNMVELLGFPQEKVLSSYAKFGNTASAAIPLTLCLHGERFLAKGSSSILVAGFGVGLSWGALHFDLDPKDKMRITELER